MTNFFSNTVRRFSRSSSGKGDRHQSPPPSSYAQHTTTSGPGSVRSSASHNAGLTALPPGSGASSIHSTGQPIISAPIIQQQQQSQYQSRYSNEPGLSSTMPNGVANDSRPISSATDQSFDFASRPVSQRPTSGALPHHQQLPSQTLSSPKPAAYPLPSQSNMIGGLSRTDQIVLKHFWDYKYQENVKRDLHYLKFPFFPSYPTHKDLLPYCEIYHLVKTSPGANIISLGSANGVYIGFELQTGSQLHIDMDDEWHNISHHRVHFRSYDSIVHDPQVDAVFKSWPKPLTIEYLEEQYHKWCLDLMSLCWEGKEVRELGGTGATPALAPGSGLSHGPTGGSHLHEGGPIRSANAGGLNGM